MNEEEKKDFKETTRKVDHSYSREIKRLTSLINYNPITGLFTWKANRKRARIGGLAGTIRKDGYRQIVINYKPYYASRLAWFFTYGKWPSMYIDHINGNKDDNRILNLRDVSPRINAINTAKIRNGKLPGVDYRRDEDRERPWYARIRVNGNLLHLGCYKTEREAYNVYREELDKIEMGAGL